MITPALRVKPVDAPGSIHLTLTGAYAGWPGCKIEEGATPDAMVSYRHAPGERGAHYLYAPDTMIDGSDPRVCPACVKAFQD